MKIHLLKQTIVYRIIINVDGESKSFNLGCTQVTDEPHQYFLQDMNGNFILDDDLMDEILEEISDLPILNL